MICSHTTEPLDLQDEVERLTLAVKCWRRIGDLHLEWHDADAQTIELLQVENEELWKRIQELAA